MSEGTTYGNGVTSGNGLMPSEEDLPLTRDMEVDLKFHNQTVTTLHLQEPTAAQAERADRELASGVNAHTLRKHQIALVAAVTKHPTEVIGQLRISQLEDAYNFLSQLSARGRRTTET